MKESIAAPAKNAKAASVQALEKTDVSGVSPSGAPVELEVVIMTKPDSSN